MLYIVIAKNIPLMGNSAKMVTLFISAVKLKMLKNQFNCYIEIHIVTLTKYKLTPIN